LIFSKSLIIASIVSGSGGLLFGFDNIVISGAIPYVSELFRLDASGVGWAAAAP
jgi:MFS transporter, SP family, arabinose:H+ symporter